MLAAGADAVYFIMLANDNSLKEAYRQLSLLLPPGSAIVCESPSLIRYVEPGAFVIMISNKSANPKDISEYQKFSHKELSLEDLDKMTALPFDFRNGSWNPV
jgi:hypothetical protein